MLSQFCFWNCFAYISASVHDKVLSCLSGCAKGQGERSRFMQPVKGVGWCSWPFEKCLGRSGAFLHCCLVLTALLEALILEFLFSDLTLSIIGCPQGGRGPDANVESIGGTRDPWPPGATAFHPVYLAMSWLAPKIDGRCNQWQSHPCSPLAFCLLFMKTGKDIHMLPGIPAHPEGSLSQFLNFDF